MNVGIPAAKVRSASRIDGARKLTSDSTPRQDPERLPGWTAPGRRESPKLAPSLTHSPVVHRLRERSHADAANENLLANDRRSVRYVCRLDMVTRLVHSGACR